MVAVGCRIEVESEKLGVEPRTGVVTAVHDALVRVQWDDGHESSFVPGAGAMRVVDEGRT
jgi:hypothetical protein